MNDYIALLLWYFWMQVFALAGWAVAAPWLRGLADRGYGISKALGVLLTGFAYWISVSLGLARNDTGAVVLALLLVVGVGLLMTGLKNISAQYQPKDVKAMLMAQYSLRPIKTLLATELLFAGAFLLCAFYRAYNPNIETAGGEKFMETMMLNAILRSPTFPPNDAWLSGFSISYYYFGYVMQAMLTRISGVPSAIAFNLSGAMTFALTVVGAFSVGYNLWSSGKLQGVGGNESPTSATSPPATLHPAALIAGLLTAFMLAFMGNLGGAIESGRCAGALPPSTVAWLDIKSLNKDTPLECNGLRPTRFYWWWTWSRTVHDYTPSNGDQEAITEFPAFSFMLGDNHPHVMNLPFVLLALSLALWVWQGGLRINSGQVASRAVQKKSNQALGITLTLPNFAELVSAIDLTPLLGLQSFLLAIVIGGLSFMNTWDLPIFGGLVLGALVLRHWLNGDELTPALIYSAVVLVLAYVIYLPFYSTFASQARGIGVNLFNGTRFSQFFVMFAPFVIILPAFLWLALKQFGLATRKMVGRVIGLLIGFVLACIIGMVLLGFVSPTLRNLIDELNRTGSALGVPRATVESRAWARFSDPWVPLFLLGSVAVVALVIMDWGLRIKDLGLGIKDKRQSSTLNPQSPTPNPHSVIFVLVLLGAGALLAVSVEFVFLLDNFGTRMNSIFKFYYQSWVLWSVAGAFALMAFAQSRQMAYRAVAGVVGVLMFFGVWYPIFTAYSRTDDFKRIPTLDGSAYIRQFNPDDAKVIDWLNANIKPATNGGATPRIAEAPGDKGKSYAYEGRIATFTGLPTALGWAGHQSQWRGNYTEPGRREPLIESFFNSADQAEARRIARDLQIQYVIVGGTEQKRYSPEGLAKFTQIAQEVFRSGDTVVYRMKG